MILQTDFLGDHNLGIFGKASDEFCLICKAVEDKREKIEEVLKVKSVAITIASTDLVGMLCSMNKNGIVLPYILTEKEEKLFFELKKLLDINMLILKTKYTALGNLILCNDKGALISNIFNKKEKKEIKDCLGVEVEFSTIAGIKTVGSCGIATNKGCLLHRDAKEKEIEIAEDVLKVKVDVGTANFGSPFVGSCVIANSKGALTGEATTGHELMRMKEALDL